MALLRSLSTATNYGERYEAERRPGDPPLSDSSAKLNGIAAFLKLQGLFIAHLSLEPDTSSELVANAVHAAERVPAWMELRVFGASARSGRLFALGCAQLLAEQRAVLERIVDEQIEDPEPIEAILAECPIPAGEESESAEEIFARSGAALQANFQATLVIARDLDEWIEEMLDKQ